MRSAYRRQTPPPDYELTCVELGSPMGEVLRRYWRPVCTSEELGDLPRKVKLLCEELVVFRDNRGARAALLAPWNFPRMGTSREERAALLLSWLALRYARLMHRHALRGGRVPQAYGRLAPCLSRNGVWRIGVRLHGPARHAAALSDVRRYRHPVPQ
jgi:hypothetical protein